MRPVPQEPSEAKAHISPEFRQRGERADGFFSSETVPVNKHAGEAVFAHVAQLAEHVLGKDEVTGSTPVMGSSSF